MITLAQLEKIAFGTPTKGVPIGEYLKQLGYAESTCRKGATTMVKPLRNKGLRVEKVQGRWVVLR